MLSFFRWEKSRRAERRMSKAIEAVSPWRAFEQLEGRQLLSAQLTVSDNSGTTDDRAVAFSNTTVGNDSAPLTFSLASNGDADLDITNFAVGGSNPDDMTVVVNDNNGDPVTDQSTFTVPIGQTFTVDVTFNPGAAGARSANITFDSTDPDVSDSSVTLAATGVGVALTTPDAPSALDATASSGTSIDLSWNDNSDDEAHFFVYASTSENGTFTKVATLAANSTDVTINSLKPNTHFFFRVTASNNAGESDPTVADAATPAVVDHVGNTFKTAKNLGKVVGSKNVNEFVGDADKIDFYKVTLTRAGTLRASISNLSSDADLYLFNLDAKGKLHQLALSENSGTNVDAVAKKLAAGNYFLRVLQGESGSNTNYTLSVSPDYAGNTRTAARVLPKLTSTKTSFTDFVGSLDKDDFYKFVLTAKKKVSIAMSGLHSDADVELLNKNGGRLAVSENDSTNNEAITKSLAAGTYFVHVLQSSGDTNYKLTLAAT